MNATTVEAAAKTIRGTARSMGIEVVGVAWKELHPRLEVKGGRKGFH